MTGTELKTIFTNLGYSGIINDFIAIPNIARIALSHNGAFYRENTKDKYYLDVAHELLFKAEYNEDGTEKGVAAIVAVDEIVGVETRNVYSASMFVGHNF